MGEVHTVDVAPLRKTVDWSGMQPGDSVYVRDLFDPMITDRDARQRAWQRCKSASAMAHGEYRVMRATSGERAGELVIHCVSRKVAACSNS